MNEVYSAPIIVPIRSITGHDPYDPGPFTFIEFDSLDETIDGYDSQEPDIFDSDIEANLDALIGAVTG